jgi:thiamine biosynthesis lipoprotein
MIQSNIAYLPAPRKKLFVKGGSLKFLNDRICDVKLNYHMFFLIFFVAFFSSAISAADNATFVSQQRQILHTYVEIKAYGDNASTAVNAAFNEMQRVNGLLNNYDNASEISAINRNAGGAAVPVSPETAEVLQAAIMIGSRSGGAHDVTVGPLLKLWGFSKETPGLDGAAPTAEQIREAKALVDYRALQLLPQTVRGKTVYSARLAKAGMWIDMGSISKGYCADRAMAVLKKYGIQRALVAAGGTICTIGRKPDGSAWKVAVRHPRKEGEIMTFIPLENASISTSGDYERFYMKNKKRLGHIIDPHTGKPVERMQSVSVIGPTGIETDSIDTTIFVLGPEKGKKLIESFPGTAALLVSHDGKITMSRNWPEKVVMY